MSSMQGTRGMRNATGGHKVGQMQNFTPEQMQLFQRMFSQLGPDSFLSKLAGGDEETFNQMEAPALRQFSGIQGNLASRFSGMGMGARRSSGFKNTMNAAGSDFAQDLQSKRMGLQNQAIKDLHGMSTDLLNQRPFKNFLIEPNKKKSFLEQIFGEGIFGGGGENMSNALKLMAMFL